MKSDLKFPSEDKLSCSEAWKTSVGEVRKFVQLKRISEISKSKMRGAGGEETVAWRQFKRDVVPFVAMFAVECTTVGSNTLYKAATLRGLNFYVFVFYSYVVSTLLLLPLSFIFGRSSRLPSAKSPLFFKIFLLGLTGFMSQIAGCKGIEYSSPTLASAMSNLTPAFTFTLAVIFRFHLVLLRFCFGNIVWTMENRVFLC